MLLAFTTVMVAVPQGQVKAATKIQLHWSFPNIVGRQKIVQVKKGAKNLYIGDYLSVTEKGEDGEEHYYRVASNLSGVTYKSSKPSVVKVDSKTGKLTLKKYGTAKISATYKGTTKKCTIKVMSKVPDFKKNEKSYLERKCEKNADALVKAFGKKLTSENRYEVLSIYRKTPGWGLGTAVYVKTDYESETWEKVCSIPNPTLGRAKAIVNKLATYAEERNPFSADGAKRIEIIKLSGSEKTITATISKKVDADQIFGAQFEYGWDQKVTEKKTVDFPIYIRDTRDGHKYYAIATLKKGSDKITIKTKNLMLEEDVTYELVQHDYIVGEDWLKGPGVIAFKAE